MTQLSSFLIYCSIALIGLNNCNAIKIDGRILGGEEADANATPYAASLRVDNAHACGASILDETHLVTAAHCLYRNAQLIDASRLSIRVGSTNQYAGGRIYAISKVTPHPDFYKLTNNIAVITTSEPLAWTTRIQPIALPSSDSELPQEGDEVIVAGWGTTVDGSTSYKIREIALTYSSSAVCLDAYSDQDSRSFCLSHALKEGTCHGDGGCGAVYNNELVGLTNFVVGACGSRYPDVFVNVRSYLDWLNEQLAA
ncbi:uncharacterized protein Dwil_GK25505 [Drosophila willistoni]|uniref:trypsin n=1 Tax=Drosophila willistoni TaxID=7260 RepID=B4NDT4_DROWI|nr:chymotrypsin-1 [Drosophila willistoni]EDW81903.1 uncharacterized protein Dwil_GK25505 [Drosophila willistoni]